MEADNFRFIYWCKSWNQNLQQDRNNEFQTLNDDQYPKTQWYLILLENKSKKDKML